MFAFDQPPGGLVLVQPPFRCVSSRCWGCREAVECVSYLTSDYQLLNALGAAELATACLSARQPIGPLGDDEAVELMNFFALVFSPYIRRTCSR